MSAGNLLSTNLSPTVPTDLRTVDPRAHATEDKRRAASDVVALMVSGFPDADTLADMLGLTA